MLAKMPTGTPGVKMIARMLPLRISPSIGAFTGRLRSASTAKEVAAAAIPAATTSASVVAGSTGTRPLATEDCPAEHRTDELTKRDAGCQEAEVLVMASGIKFACDHLLHAQAQAPGGRDRGRRLLHQAPERCGRPRGTDSRRPAASLRPRAMDRRADRRSDRAGSRRRAARAQTPRRRGRRRAARRRARATGRT